MGAWGHANPRPLILQCIGRNVRESDAILRRNFGEDFPVDTMRSRRNRLMQKKIKEDGLPVKPGIVDALLWIADHSLPCAIASSSDHAVIVGHLKRAGLERFFSVIVGGDEIAHGKPDPEIFLEAARRLGASPDHCLVFEDSLNGIKAARHAGMRVAMIPDLVPITEECQAYVDDPLSSGREIIPLLMKLCAKE